MALKKTSLVDDSALHWTTRLSNIERGQVILFRPERRQPISSCWERCVSAMILRLFPNGWSRYWNRQNWTMITWKEGKADENQKSFAADWHLENKNHDQTTSNRTKIATTMMKTGNRRRAKIAPDHWIWLRRLSAQRASFSQRNSVHHNIIENDHIAWRGTGNWSIRSFERRTQPSRIVRQNREPKGNMRGSWGHHYELNRDLYRDWSISNPGMGWTD